MGFSTTFESVEPSRDAIDSRVGPLVLEFGAAWCSHCLAAAPLVHAAFGRFPDVPHVKIEDGRGRPLGRSYRIKLWPTLIFLHSGKEVARLVRPTDSGAIEQALAQIAGEKAAGEDIESTAIRASE